MARLNCGSFMREANTADHGVRSESGFEGVTVEMSACFMFGRSMELHVRTLRLLPASGSPSALRLLVRSLEVPLTQSIVGMLQAAA